MTEKQGRPVGNYIPLTDGTSYERAFADFSRQTLARTANAFRIYVPSADLSELPSVVMVENNDFQTVVSSFGGSTEALPYSLYYARTNMVVVPSALVDQAAGGQTERMVAQLRFAEPCIKAFATVQTATRLPNKSFYRTGFSTYTSDRDQFLDPGGVYKSTAGQILSDAPISEDYVEFGDDRLTARVGELAVNVLLEDITGVSSYPSVIVSVGSPDNPTLLAAKNKAFKERILQALYYGDSSRLEVSTEVHVNERGQRGIRWMKLLALLSQPKILIGSKFKGSSNNPEVDIFDYRSSYFG
jgi:hypothetical protein